MGKDIRGTDVFEDADLPLIRHSLPEFQRFFPDVRLASPAWRKPAGEFEPALRRRESLPL